MKKLRRRCDALDAISTFVLICILRRIKTDGMAAAEPLPDPDSFKSLKRKLRRILFAAFETIAFGLYYPNCDVTLQFRDGKCKRMDIREFDETMTA